MPSSARPHLALHSFPTRRSSDLRGADLFESTAAENIGAMILAATLAKSFGSAISAEVVIGVMLFPLVARAFGILASILGLFATKIRSEEHTSELQSHHDLVCRLLPAPTLLYTRSLHDALPISAAPTSSSRPPRRTSAR